MERLMKLTLIALGAGAGCLLLANAAMAGPCTAQIDALQKELQATDAGMGPTGTGTGVGPDTMTQSGANAVSPSGTPQVPTTPATGTMNQASQNKATSPQDVQNQNTGQGTVADQAAGAVTVPGTQSALQSLQVARQLDQTGDAAGCQDALDRAQNLMQKQP
jgi:hypothetical protein